MDAEIEDLLDAKRRQFHKDSDPGKPLLQHLAQQYPLGDEGNIIIGREPFHMMKKGGPVKAKPRKKAPKYMRGGGIVGKNKLIKGYKKGGQV